MTTNHRILLSLSIALLPLLALSAVNYTSTFNCSSYFAAFKTLAFLNLDAGQTYNLCNYNLSTNLSTQMNNQCQRVRNACSGRNLNCSQRRRVLAQSSAEEQFGLSATSESASASASTSGSGFASGSELAAKVDAFLASKDPQTLYNTLKQYPFGASNITNLLQFDINTIGYYLGNSNPNNTWIQAGYNYCFNIATENYWIAGGNHNTQGTNNACVPYCTNTDNVVKGTIVSFGTQGWYQPYVTDMLAALNLTCDPTTFFNGVNDLNSSPTNC